MPPPPRSAPSPWTRLAVALAFGAALAASGAFAQESGGAADEPVFVGQTGLVVTRPVEATLGRLRALSREWVEAEIAGRTGLADSLRRDLLATAGQLSFRRLADPAAAAGLLAVRAAASGDRDAEARALAAAESFDPGTAQNAFAAATAARRRGAWLSSWRLDAEGLARSLRQRPLAPLVRENLMLGALLVLVFAGALFVALEAATRGRHLPGRLRTFLESTVPAPFAWLLVLLLLAWPLVLPAGVLWLTAYWAVLLWGGARPSERWVLAGFLGLVCFAPVAQEHLRRSWSVHSLASARVLDHLSEDRLSGSFLADLAALQQSLPGEPAARQVLADVHRRLGQWEEARVLYGSLLEADPDNVAAILGLGAYASAKGDFRRAVEWFRQASEVDPRSAEAFFNLSQAFNSSYLFDDSRQALAAARAIDERRVSGWIGGGEPRAWVVPEASAYRREEVLEKLRQARTVAAPLGVPDWVLSLIAWAVLLLLAAAADQARRKRPAGRAPPEIPFGGRPALASSWARAVVPGLGSVEDGHGLRAVGALVPFAAAGIALSAGRWLHRLPIAFSGGFGLVIFSALTLLVAWYGGRMAWLRWRDA